MHIQRITLINFKNYVRETVEFSPGLNCLTGLNGMGKTNLLDALYYCCMTKSYFTPQDKFSVREGEDFFRIEANLSSAGKNHHLEIKVKPGETKVFTYEGETYDQLSEHIGKMPVVVVAPKDVELIHGSSSERRKYMDAMISQISSEYLGALLLYTKLLQQRNAHLKAVKEGARADKQLLETYAKKMGAPATVLKTWRSRVSANIHEKLAPIYHMVSRGAEEVSIAYRSGMADGTMEEVCQQNFQRDCLLGRTSAGVHRDDFPFRLDGQDMKKYASQGQLKSFLIALNLCKYKILHEETYMKPLILLDDSFGKLDFQRTQQLLTLLSGEEYGQVVITDASTEKISSFLSELNIPGKVMEVESGRVTELTEE